MAEEKIGIKRKIETDRTSITVKNAANLWTCENRKIYRSLDDNLYPGNQSHVDQFLHEFFYCVAVTYS